MEYRKSGQRVLFPCPLFWGRFKCAGFVVYHNTSCKHKRMICYVTYASLVLYKTDSVWYYNRMTLFIYFFALLQTFSISLGVGSSTLAIINFFVAIADGKIDETERKMMGIVYIVLRVAMVGILVTTLGLIGLEVYADGAVSLSTFDIVQLFTLCILFINAVLMTMRLMPSIFGPAIQAGSWYTLGALVALRLQDMTDFTFIQFLVAFIVWIAIAIGIVNGIMSNLRLRD